VPAISPLYVGNVFLLPGKVLRETILFVSGTSRGYEDAMRLARIIRSLMHDVTIALIAGMIALSGFVQAHASIIRHAHQGEISRSLCTPSGQQTEDGDAGTRHDCDACCLTRVDGGALLRIADAMPHAPLARLKQNVDRVAAHHPRSERPWTRGPPVRA
jgi:hypothetical protein